MNDENCPSGLAFTQQCKSTDIRVKSPLKPVNDVHRLMHTTAVDKTPVNSPLSYIRQLDSAERWKERNCIITKQIHSENQETAKSILLSLIDGLNVYDKQNPWLSEASVVGDSCPLPSAAPPVIDVMDELTSMLGGLNMAPNTPQRPVSDQAGGIDSLKDDENVDDSWHSVVDEDEVIVPVQNNHNEKAENDCNGDVIGMEKIDVLVAGKKNQISSASSIDSAVSEDPFKSGSQLVNSPDIKQTFPSEHEIQPLEQTEKLHSETGSSETTKSDKEFCSIQPVSSQNDGSEALKKETLLAEGENLSSKSLNEGMDNPFVPKTQILNSPITKHRPSQEEKQNQVQLEDIEDPFAPKKQIMNSPITVSRSNSEELKVEDPFAPNKQILNSPIVQESSQPTNELNLDDINDPFAPKSQIMNSPVGDLNVHNKDPFNIEDVEENPFAPKKQIANSPNLQPKDPLSVEDIEIPFGPKKGVANSPKKSNLSARGREEVLTTMEDPVMTVPPSTQPASVESHEITPETGALVSDPSEDIGVSELVTLIKDGNQEPLEVENLNQSKNQVFNSPKADYKKEVVQNPFESKSQILNSPVGSVKSVSPKKIPSKADEDLDQNPFISKSQIPNSPVVQTLEQETSEVQNPLEEKYTSHNTDNAQESECEQYPFQTKTNVSNSPVHNNSKVNAEESEQISLPARAHSPNSSTTADAVSESERQKDSFQSKNEISSNGSLKLENVGEVDCIQDSLKTQIMTDDAVVNRPESVDEEYVEQDPFKSQNKTENSPVKKSGSNDTEQEPFTSKNQIPNSPINSKTVSEEDPFIPKKQIMNSPKIEDSSDHLIKTPVITPSGNNEVLEVPSSTSAVTNINNTSASNQTEKDVFKKSSTRTESGVNFTSPHVNLQDNEVFIPAEQAFNDADFFDMLEKAGQDSHTGPAKRGSLLLKFDPLQERRETAAFLKLSSPGPVPKQHCVALSRGNASMAEESISLFGTPPKVQRRRTITRNIHNRTIAASIEEENNASEVDMIMTLDGEADPMPSILSENMSQKTGAQLVEITQMAKYTDADITQMKSELSLKFQEMVMKKDKEFQGKVQEKEKEFQETLTQKEKELESKYSEIETLNGKVKTLQGKLKSLREALAEYEAITAELTAQANKASKEAAVTLEKKNNLSEDNKALENSFDDLYKRYEKMKTSLHTALSERKTFQEKIESANEVSMKSKEAYKKLKETAETKLSEQVEKYESLENTMKAALKHKDMKIQKLEVTLESKTKENKELTDLCDSLIKKAEAE